MNEEKKTAVLNKQDAKASHSVPIVLDVSALYEIIRANANVKVRKDAIAHLIKLVNGGTEIDCDEIAALFDTEKNLTIATELKRLLNKLQIRQKFAYDPTSRYDRKLSPTEEAKILEEMDRLKKLYDKSSGEKGAFEKKYKILGKIAEGGMGRIFHGVRLEDDRPVAIKYLLLKQLSKKTNVERMIARFRREGDLLTKRLSHHNIIKAHEYGEADGEYFLVMEYVENGTLEDMIKAELLDLDTFKTVSCQLSDAVEYLHRNGIIHRDIKPSNILIDKGNGSLQIKLTDFGLARDKRNSKLSKISFQAGTDEYSSPQQLQDARAADERDDIYSMGKTLYEMLTGRTLKNDEPYVEIIKLNSAMPTEIDTTVRKCIEYRKENRFQTVSEIRKVISDLL